MLLECRIDKGEQEKTWVASGRFRVTSDEVLCWLGRSVVGLYAQLMLDMDVVWDASLPQGPKIIAANHPTTVDPFLLLTLVPEQMSILVTEMCFKVPVFGTFLQAAGHVPVLRSDGRAALGEAEKLLRNGRTIGIFPDGAPGRREEEEGRGRPRTGVARLALSTGAPVVPVGIHLPHGRIWFRETKIDDEVLTARWYLHGPYGVTVGEPMYIEGDAEDRPYVRAAARRVMQRIDQLSRRSAQRMEGMSQSRCPSSSQVAHPAAY